MWRAICYRMAQEYEEVEPGMWVLPLGDGGGRVVIHHSPPLLLLRVKVLDVPDEGERCAGLFRQLLEYNALDLIHGAYGIEEDDVILTDALELENLDFNEFQASLDSLQVALASHLRGAGPVQSGKREQVSREEARPPTRTVGPLPSSSYLLPLTSYLSRTWASSASSRL